MFRSKYFFIYLLLITLLFCIFFPLTDIPYWDEHFYAEGNYSRSDGWSPFYSSVYSLLGILKQSKLFAFEFINISLVFIALPLLFYIIPLKFGLTERTSFYIALTNYLSAWHLNADPKVMLFSFFLILVAFLIRISENIPHRIIFFYCISILSIYTRQDNLIYFFTFFIYDIYHLYTLKSFKKNKFNIITIAVFALIIMNVLGHPFASKRSWMAFRDHFILKNYNYFDAGLNLSISDQAGLFFDADESIIRAIRNRPDEVFAHFGRNMMKFSPGIFSFGTSGATYKKTIVFMSFILFILIHISSKNKLYYQIKSKVNLRILFLIALILKCLCIGVFLQPKDKYIFESHYSLLLLFALIQTKLSKRARNYKGKTIKYSYISMIVILFFYQVNRLDGDRYLRNLVKSIKEIPKIDEKKIFASSTICFWLDFGENCYASYRVGPKELEDGIKSERFDIFISDKYSSMHLRNYGYKSSSKIIKLNTNYKLIKRASHFNIYSR